MDDYPEANERHYAFMLHGLSDVKDALSTRKIRFVIRHGSPPQAAIGLARQAALIVCDRGYLRHQRRWRDEVADRAGCRVEQVETDIVVPVAEASDKREFAARTLRPKILRRRDQYLVQPRHAMPTPDYDSYDSLPAWAKMTLDAHHRDERPALYSRDELEQARTHDPHWNAAQREMNATGFMHNAMRMYWGKKVLEWSPTPREAFDRLLYLNNRLFLCGRDPVSYANVGWIFGLHDRPWARRPIFGNVRYLNDSGLDRKFDMKAYVARVAKMEQELAGTK